MRRQILTVAGGGLAVLVLLVLALAGLGWAASRVALLRETHHAAATAPREFGPAPRVGQTRSSAARGASSVRRCLQSVSRGTMASAGRSV